MAAVASPHMHLLSTSLLGVAVVAGALLLLGTAGPFHEWSGLDFSYLTFPLVLLGVLVLLSRVALWSQGTRLARILIWQPAVAGRQHRIDVLLVAQSLLVDSAWVALTAGLLASVGNLTATVSAHPDTPDLTSIESYLRTFDSLTFWAVLLLAPFVIARAAATVWPRIARAMSLPVGHLVAFGVAYVFLADGGIFSTAYDFPGSPALIGLGLALAFSYTASVLRVEVNAPRSPRAEMLTRGALVLAEVAWVVALVAAVAALPSALEATLREGDNLESLTPYLSLLRSLVLWSMAVLVPVAMVRAASAFWPTVGRILTFPTQLLVLLAAIYLVFSSKGILSTSFELHVSQFMVVLPLSVVLSYIASVLLNVSLFRSAGRFRSAAVNVAPVARAAIVGLVPAMVVWVTLNNLPAIGERLLDYSLTRDFGETYLPLFTELFDVRYAAAGLGLAMGLATSLPNALGISFLRYRPLLTAVGYSVAACLAWIVGAGLSELSHGYALAGAIASAGMFTLALSQLAGYTANSPNYMLAGISEWLSESKVRGFTLGASVAFYGLLLRPALHEVMWFAALYEYLAVLALMLFLLLRIKERVHVDADKPNVAPPVWPGWSHHEQRLETKADPRAAFMSGLQRQFIEFGEWRLLWSYLMGLLYPSHAPLESSEAVCRAFRKSALARVHLNLPGEEGRVRSRRMAAFEESLAKAEEGLANPSRSLPRVDEANLRQTAAVYVQRGADPEKLTATLLLAHYQRGDNLNEAIDHWFTLLTASEPSSRWFAPPWVRSRARSRQRDQRTQLVDECVIYLFGAPYPTPSEPSAAMAGATA